MAKPVYTSQGLRRATHFQLAALGIVALVFAGAIGPSLFGYIGSENYEWTTLGVAVISGILGFGLTLLLVLTVIARVLLSRAQSRAVDRP